MFTNPWRELIETCVKPVVTQQFQLYGVPVCYTSQHISRRQGKWIDGEKMEIDVLLENTVEVVLISVKSTLKVAHVDEFLEDLKQLGRFFPKYAKMRVYAAVAGLTYDEDSDRYAYKKGLFVLGMVGQGMIRIQNDQKFRPHNFGSTPDETTDESNETLQAAS